MGILIDAPEELLAGPDEEDLAGEAMLPGSEPGVESPLGDAPLTAAPPSSSEG
jgi:hypothetical protein